MEEKAPLKELEEIKGESNVRRSGVKRETKKKREARTRNLTKDSWMKKETTDQIIARNGILGFQNNKKTGKKVNSYKHTAQDIKMI